MTDDTSARPRPTIALDLDGVLADFRAGWQGVDIIGDPIPGAREFAGALYEFADILIYTARCGEDLNGDEIEKRAAVIRAWLARHSIPYTDIWTGRGKPTARAYVDDCAVECRPQGEAHPAGRSAVYIQALQAARRLCGLEASTLAPFKRRLLEVEIENG